MPPFRAGGEDEYPDRIRAAADTYRLRIDSYQMAKTTPSKYEEGGRDQIRFLLEFLSIADDENALLIGTDDNELDPEARVIFFFDPERMGLKPRVARSRKFLSSALGIAVDAVVEYESLEELAEDLVGRELIADVTVSTTPKGTYNNIEDTRPIQTRQRRQRAEKPALVEEAEKVFAEDVVEDDEDY